MKNKKKLIFLLLPLVFLLTSCAPSNKQTLINYFDKVSHQEKMQQSFKMRLTKLNLTDSDTDKGTEKIIKTLVKDGSVTGDYYYDGSNVHAEFNLKAVGENIPLELYGNANKLYLNTDTISSVYKAAQDFGSDLPIHNFSKLSGKYVDVLSFAKEADLLSGKEIKEFQSTQKSLMKSSKNSATVLKETIKSLPDSSVTKKDNEIIAVMHKKDIASLMEKYKKEIDKNKDVKDNPIKQKDIDEFNKDFKAFDYTIKYNSKEDTLKYTIYMKLDEGDEVEIQIDTKFDKFKGEISMPAKSKIIDNETFAEEISDIFYEDF